MIPEMKSVDEARGLAVLLHPHPHFGGNRFHPFIEALFNRLPHIGINAIRFDFSSAEISDARDEVVAAIDQGAAHWPGLPVILVGYSFGAGVAAGIADERIVGWYLLAPPTTALSDAPIGRDPRPKAVAVPEYDQFSPPAAIAQVVAPWAATTVTTVPDADHFLGALPPVVDGALQWIAGVIKPNEPPAHGNTAND